MRAETDRVDPRGFLVVTGAAQRDDVAFCELEIRNHDGRDDGTGLTIATVVSVQGYSVNHCTVDQNLDRALTVVFVDIGEFQIICAVSAAKYQRRGRLGCAGDTDDLASRCIGIVLGVVAGQIHVLGLDDKLAFVIRNPFLPRGQTVITNLVDSDRCDDGQSRANGRSAFDEGKVCIATGGADLCKQIEVAKLVGNQKSAVEIDSGVLCWSTCQNLCSLMRRVHRHATNSTGHYRIVVGDFYTYAAERHRERGATVQRCATKLVEYLQTGDGRKLIDFRHL